MVQDLGEVNMADGQTLVDLATWAIENFPADKVVLILSDHGMGWPGGWSDPAPGGSDSNRAPLASKIGDHLWLSEIDQALWDDFLAYHYHDITFESQPARPSIPGVSAPSRAPGLGRIETTPVKASSGTATPGQPVQLSVDISGENIGYIYLFVGYYDRESNSIYMADRDYLESPDTRELEGVYYPQWPENGEFTLEFSWDPYIFAIMAGDQLIPAFFTPQDYGATAAEAVYTVDGIYTFAGTGEARYARLYFRDGKLEQVFGFTSAEETGTPREITPESGDTFTMLDLWMDLDAGGNASGVTPVEGETFMMGIDPISWEEVYAAPGQYVVGFIIEDLDGNVYPVYTQVVVD